MPRSSPDARLVPSSAAEFRSRAFWDGFFEARGDAAFEWYGDWASLRPLVLPLCRADRGATRVLVLGCGNSELSAQMYDDGVTDIVNTDFCAAVIRSMLLAHARARPRMRWRVADITRLDASTFPDASFDLVLDKGGLDALHSDADDADGGGAAAARGMLACAARVTAPGGAYACVTLGQPHVLAALLAAFRDADWALALDAPPPPPDMAAAPLQPLLVVARRREKGAASATGPLPPVVSRIRPTLTAPNADQLNGVAGVVAAENEARRGGSAAAGPAPATAPLADPYAALSPGRTTRLTLPAGAAKPAYDVTVVDVASPPAGPPSCAVFVIPLGRDHEWLFATDEGLATVASQVGAGRVIVVALRRGVDHGGLAAVRAALSPHVAPLAPAPLRGVAGAVPIVTVGDGIGSRTPVASVASTVAGCDVIVEDVGPPPNAPRGVVGLRRLVFGGAAGLVQSEAVLVQGEPRPAVRSGRGAGKQPPAAAAAVALADHLPAAYHSAVLAHLALAGGVSGKRVAVIGLGGGGLPAALTAHAGCDVASVELDPVVVDVATRHFGFGGGVTVGDGIDFVTSSQPSTFAAIIVDAGGGDGAGAMTCPPPPFATAEFVAAAARALAGGGVLIVNVVSRAPAPLAALVATLKAGFAPAGTVLEIDVPDDVNRVLAAFNTKVETVSGRAAAARLPRALREAGAVVGGPSVAELVDLVVVR